MLEHLKATSDQYDALARRLCTLDVEKCPELGWRLLAAGRPAEAAEVYERYAAHARDRVGVSNAVGWLVKYYWDTGRRERATALAEEAGETLSALGLEIQGTVLERQGRTDEARATFEHIRDRYDSGGAALAGYYLRLARQTGESQYLTRAAAAVPELFTNGLEHADLAWLPAPPTDGVVFTRFSRVAERAGLRPTDVLVALDGYRIRSTGQYHVVARGSFEPTMHFIVWRDGRNQRVDAHVPQRLMGVGMDTHPSALRSPS
jgi:tetratricopeptide (TPR) repeat protein